MSEKPCSACQVTKTLALFPKNAASPDGHYSLCKECRSLRKREYRDRPHVQEREKARLKAQYEANKSAIGERRKQRYAANPEAALAPNRAWREKNIEKHRALCRNWAKANPEAMRLIVRNRRAREMAAPGTHTAQDIAALYQQQGGLCVYCPANLEDGYHVDHRHPLIRGGSNGPENLQLLCPTCNRRKADKLPEEFARELARAAP